jgi:hypothetical protein
MTGSPVAALVRGWAGLYTRGLPADVRAARRDELDDDLWCEHEEALATGRSRRALDAELALRLLFGIPADISWRLTYSGGATRPIPDRRPSTSTSVLGVLAIVGGLIWGILFILFIPYGDAVWTGGFGVLGVAGSVGAAIVFSAVALGLAWRFQDHVGPLGAVGAVLVMLGAAMSLVGFLVVFAIGSTMLMLDLARIGVLSRTVTFAHVAGAIAVVVASVFAERFDELTFSVTVTEAWPALAGAAAGRALMVGVLAPYVLSWIAIGASLLRGVRAVRVTSG